MSLLRLITCLCCSLAFASLAGAFDPPSTAKPAADAPAARPVPVVRPVPSTEEWRQDATCQMVFFAVLEGLYTDGVPDEVVDLIVPPQSKHDTNVKHCFVFNCPMCHAAYEAFVLYQRRQAFQGANEKRSTFGKAFDPSSEAGKALLVALRSEEPRTRVFAMGSLIRPWIERKIKALNLSEAEQKELVVKLLEYAKRGNQLFLVYRGDRSSAYYEWQFYGGCQACEAAQAVARRAGGR